MPAGILVVDDDPSFRALAIRLLTGAGLEIAGEADTVRSAVEAALELEPAAILLDIGLPDGDGFAVADQLATLPWRPRIIFTSSDADAAGTDALRRARAAAFIPKHELPDVALRELFAVS
jgi:DNA-binding NarL/FixJ family response regulator